MPITRSGRLLAWVIALLLDSILSPARAVVLEGYPAEMSVTQGGTLELHVRSDLATYDVTIWRQRQSLEFVTDAGTYAGQNFPIPAEPWERGCDWPVTCRIPVLAEWRPGAYAARLDAAGHIAWIPFVVLARVPGSLGSILVQMSTATWQAYNRYGGKSLYASYIPSNPGRAYRVSFHRPYNNSVGPTGSGRFFLWDAQFISYLESMGYVFEVCTSVDLHRHPGLLDSYRLFISEGHDEYWSKEQYDEIERFANAGGNLAFFSADVLWWQVRYEDQEQTLVCYKSASLDPLNGIDNSRVTTNWHAAPVSRPPVRLIGVYYNGSAGITPGCYQVFDPHHWAYQGVAVDSGQCFGYPMVAYEIDARNIYSPKSLEVIAHTERPDVPDGVMRPADMVYYERSPAYGYPDGRGGKIFAAGTINYVQGLVSGYNAWTQTVGQPDAVALTITRNVLDRMGCSLRDLRLGRPADGVEAHSPQALLQWYPAVAQRPDLPVHYELHWQGGGSSDSLSTTNLSAWVPVVADSLYHWWVEAVSDCGAKLRTPAWALRARAPVDSDNAATTPLLQVLLRPECMSILISPREASRGSVRIFDVAGRIVRSFDNQSFLPPTTRLTWQLRGNGTVSSGIYFVEARVGSRSAHQRVFLVH